MPSTTCSNAPSRQARGFSAGPQATNKPVKAVSHRNRRGRLVTDVKRSSTFCGNHPALKRAPPNGSRLSCSALVKDSFPSLRALSASSACWVARSPWIWSACPNRRHTAVEKRAQFLDELDTRPIGVDIARSPVVWPRDEIAKRSPHARQ